MGLSPLLLCSDLPCPPSSHTSGFPKVCCLPVPWQVGKWLQEYTPCHHRGFRGLLLIHSFNEYFQCLSSTRSYNKCREYHRRLNRHVHYPHVFYKSPLRTLAIYSFMNSSPLVYSPITLWAPNLSFFKES